MHFPMVYDVLYPLIFAYNNKKFSDDYYFALMDNGVLKKDNERFDKEVQVWREARQVLGVEEVRKNMKVGEFKDLVLKHLDRFDDGGIVREWLGL